METQAVSWRAWLNLVVATLAFTVGVWAWAMLSPLAPRFQTLLSLSHLQVAALVAVPVLVGAAGRVPIGALADRFGGRVMMSLVALVSAVPVMFLALTDGYASLLIGGIVLGLGGTMFAVGVPHVSAWFPASKRGLATGIFGAGNAGSAITALSMPGLVDSMGKPQAFAIVAVALMVVSILSFVLLRNAPSWKPSREGMIHKIKSVVGMRVVWEMSILYAIVFGGFVAMSNYLPTYLRSEYGLSVTDASAKMAGFVALAVLMRPIGGYLADKITGLKVLIGSLTIIGLCAILIAFKGLLMVHATIGFLGLAVGLGLGAGAVFAYIARNIPASKVGVATGIVGAIGGLGGFFPPFVMGVVKELTGSYSIGLMLLSEVAFAALVYTWVRLYHGYGR